MMESFPSPQLQDLVRQTEELVAKWQPKLPWLAGWSIRVEPMEESHDPFEQHPMEIETAAYVKTAIIRVKASITEPDDFLGAEHSLELAVLHELTHVLLEPLRTVVYNWAADPDHGAPSPAMLHAQDAEETAVWHICRLLAKGIQP